MASGITEQLKKITRLKPTRVKSSRKFVNEEGQHVNLDRRERKALQLALRRQAKQRARENGKRHG